MSREITRRRFVQTSALAGATLSAYHTSTALAQSESAGETVTLAVMGVNGRGTALARGFASQPNAQVAYVCDVDSRAIDKALGALEGKQSLKAKGATDFRKALDDDGVDALVIAAPDHWHAPATILGCKAGKHVYVEKPCSHNPREGELMVEAARKYKRTVTMGTQRRSWPGIIEGIEKVRGGEIGNVHFSRAWYNNRRGSIGKGKNAPVPDWLNWDLWQGPAPRKDYRDNIVHYNWHWLWHWGTGELGNNGVHALDLSRWGLGVDYPVRVASSGGRWRWDDDQQTPDTHVVSYDFPANKTICWEGLSWSPRGFEGSMFGATFHGDAGTLVVTGAGYKIYDMHNKLVAEQGGSGGDATHQANFLECIKTGEAPYAEIEIGHKTTLLCHLGNIAQRTVSTLVCNPENGHIENNAAAMELWGREYEKGWAPVV